MTAVDIIIQNTNKQPIYEQINSQIRDMILSGKLKEGEALPSMRLLAKELRISVITTKRAYEELERGGWIVTITGKGSFVAGADRELLREERLKKVEEALCRAVEASRPLQLSLEDMEEMLRLVYEEE